MRRDTRNKRWARAQVEGRGSARSGAANRELVGPCVGEMAPRDRFLKDFEESNLENLLSKMVQGG